jgi:hypothetical protein
MRVLDEIAVCFAGRTAARRSSGMLSMQELEAQSALELPNRELLLVTVIIGSVRVDVPISVAANLCDIDVNVLAKQLDRGTTTCTATAS